MSYLITNPTSERCHTKLLHRYGLNLDGPFSESVIPCLEFSIEFQSNQLIYQKEYTKRQQIIYVLIQHLHDREGWGYRKISKWLNQRKLRPIEARNGSIPPLSQS